MGSLFLGLLLTHGHLRPSKQNTHHWCSATITTVSKERSWPHFSGLHRLLPTHTGLEHVSSFQCRFFPGTLLLQCGDISAGAWEMPSSLFYALPRHLCNTAGSEVALIVLCVLLFSVVLEMTFRIVLVLSTHSFTLSPQPVNFDSSTDTLGTWIASAQWALLYLASVCWVKISESWAGHQSSHRYHSLKSNISKMEPPPVQILV